MAQVIIRNKEGAEYEIPRSAFTKRDMIAGADGVLTTFEAAGFKIIGDPDDVPADGPVASEPAPKAKK